MRISTVKSSQLSRSLRAADHLLHRFVVRYRHVVERVVPVYLLADSSAEAIARLAELDFKELKRQLEGGVTETASIEILSAEEGK